MDNIIQLQTSTRMMRIFSEDEHAIENQTEIDMFCKDGNQYRSYR